MWRQQPPIVALDVDGTIGVYHHHFHQFAEQWTGKKLRSGYDGSMPFYKWLGLSKATYRECKFAYRRGGLKRSMPHYTGSREFSVAVRKAGARIIICTTRPFRSLDNIEPDTVHNLKRHGVQFDYIISGERKYHDLLKIPGVRRDQVVMVLEDQDDMLAQALRLRLPAVRIRHAHNDVCDVKVDAEVGSLVMAQEVALARIQLYNEGNWATA
jgi:hypothetical protein